MILKKYKISSGGLSKNTLTILRDNNRLETTTGFGSYVVVDPPQKEGIMPPDRFCVTADKKTVAVTSFSPS